MARFLGAALAALLLVAADARAQEQKADAPRPVDAATQEAIRRAVEKAKEEIREEVRAEMQTAQSSAEFMGAVAPGPKLEFLEMDGYLRVRGQVLDGLDLDRGRDAAGFPLFPVPLQSGRSGTLATADMRLRLEPTLNVSEHVRVRAQIDVLDNYVLGSSTSSLFEASPYPSPFWSSGRALSKDDPTADREAILPKRAWGEISTPLGLLMFGRMPSEWGRGILANAGRGIDDDLGDTVDRISFTLAPVDTPIGKVNLVPILDFDAEGVLYRDPTAGRGEGQPIDAEPGDDARTYALKVVRIDTEDEIRRRLDAGRSSFNFGAYYNYRTQRWVYPEWQTVGLDGSYKDKATDALHRSAYAHIVDVWGRWLWGKWRVEAELAWIYGSIGRTYTYQPDPDDTNPADGVTLERVALGRVLERQWGGVLSTTYQAKNKVQLAAELGIASGDAAPGFGNQPTRRVPGADFNDPSELPPYGSVEGPQYGLPGDRSIRNFRFNPAYQVDLILWNRILGQVTDAWYLRPSLRWDILPGLTFDAVAIYSQALYGESTPSAVAAGTEGEDRYTLQSRGDKGLGMELDGRLTLQTGDGFQTWTELGVLQPLSGLGNELSRGWVLNVGFAAKF